MLISLSVVSSVQCCIVMSGTGEPVRTIFISHRPALRTGNSTARGVACRQQRQQARAPNQMKEAVASCVALPAVCCDGSETVSPQ